MRDDLTSACARPKRMLVSLVAEGQAVVVPVSGNGAREDSVYTLNESATMLWAMLEAGRGLDELACGLQTEYGLSFEEALDDARQFVESLLQEGLVEPV